MSYRIVSEIVPIQGPDLRRRVEAAISDEIAQARAEELDQALDRILDGGSSAHRAAVPPKYRAAVDMLEGRARALALHYEALNAATTLAEHTNPSAAPACAAREAAALKEAQAAEASALAARAAAKKAIPQAIVAHVVAEFDTQIKDALDETCARASATPGATVLSFELTGHVEDADHYTRGWWNVEVPAPRVRAEGWHPDRPAILVSNAPRSRMTPLRVLEGK